MSQENIKRSKESVQSEDDQKVPQGATVKEGLDEDVDSILDDIDAALESNAEEFVRGFIQKGGQ